MITLSNGWFSNTISQSRIAKIAKAAQESVRAEQARHAEPTNPLPEIVLDEQDGPPQQIDDSREMGLADRFVDHVFCGGVKFDYMNHLFELTKKKVMIEVIRGKEANLPVEQRSGSELNELVVAVLSGNHDINELTPGKSMQFGTDTAANSATKELYLVYRDTTSFTTIGIPVLMQSSLSPPPSAGETPEASALKFKKSGDIRISDLQKIKELGYLQCGDQRYTVRFTDLNEPILLRLGQNNENDAIQSRLRNLWVIDHLKREFSAMQTLPGAQQPALHLPRFNHLRASSLRPDKWAELGIIVGDKFKLAVSIMHDRLNVEINVINQQLSCFELLTNPTQADIAALRSLRERIIDFRQTQNNVVEKISDIRSQLEEICKVMKQGSDAELQEVIRVRMINFTDQLLLFTRSGMSASEYNAFRALCAIQKEFFSYALPGAAFRDEFDIEHSWTHSAIHPPASFFTQYRILFNVMKDPMSCLETVFGAMEDFRRYKRECFEMKNSQIELGNKYDQLLRMHVPNEDDIVIFRVIKSLHFNINVIRLRRIVDDCLSPGIEFTRPEFDTIQRTADEIWEML